MDDFGGARWNPPIRVRVLQCSQRHNADRFADSHPQAGQLARTGRRV